MKYFTPKNFMKFYITRSHMPNPGVGMVEEAFFLCVPHQQQLFVDKGSIIDDLGFRDEIPVGSLGDELSRS